MSSELDDAISRLGHDSHAVQALFSGISESQACWKPSGAEWSLLEVVCHLCDEEREDFRTRLDILLHNPETSWPPIDPPGWVIDRSYNQRNPHAALHDFQDERGRSLVWLRSLDSPDWTSSGLTPWGATMSAGQMLRSWLAHDMLHIRQMAGLHHRYLEKPGGPGSVDYAGGW